MLSSPIGRASLLAMVALLALALFGCGGNSLTQPFGTNPNDTSKERVLNTLVGGPSAAVDIDQRSVPLNPAPLAFGQGTSYATVASGISIETDAYESGTTTPVAPAASVTLTHAFLYTEILAGIYGTAGTTAPRLIQFSDNFPSSVPASSVALRLGNLSPDSPPVTLYNTAGTPATAVAITGLGNVTYGSLSNSGNANYVITTAGAYNLTVRDNAGNILATLNPITLTGGHIYTVFLYGLVNPAAGQPPAAAILLTDQ